MKKDNVVSLKKPGENSDTLTELLRDGARTLLFEAVQAELAEFLSQYQAVRDARGRQCVVRNGYLRVIVKSGVSAHESSGGLVNFLHLDSISKFDSCNHLRQVVKPA